MGAEIVCHCSQMASAEAIVRTGGNTHANSELDMQRQPLTVALFDELERTIIAHSLT